MIVMVVTIIVIIISSREGHQFNVESLSPFSLFWSVVSEAFGQTARASGLCTKEDNNVHIGRGGGILSF